MSAEPTFSPGPSAAETDQPTRTGRLLSIVRKLIGTATPDDRAA